MKLNTLLIPLIAIMLLGTIGFSCNTSKTANAVNNTLIISLEESLTGKYLMSTYKEYGPTKVAKSNKTLNQYSAHFNCSASKFATLMDMLDKDDKVSSVQESKAYKTEKQSSKNVDHAKTKSIRKNN